MAEDQNTPDPTDPVRFTDFDAARRVWMRIESEPEGENGGEDGLPVIEGYTVLSRLGAGGGGEVFLGNREGSDRPVAIKVLSKRLGDGSGGKRAWRELQMLSELRLECLPRLLDYGEHGGHLFLVTEHVEGLCFSRHCEEHDLSRRERVAMLARVADAVQSIHAVGVIHRDIKPDNIIIDGRDAPMIIDFGIAALLSDDAVETLTLEGAPLGSPAFMSPEQARGERMKLSVASDGYGLGATAYVILTGKTPHDMDTSLHEAVRRVGQDEPRDPHDLVSDLPGDLGAVLRKAVERKPEDRYASADAFAADLRRWLEGKPVEAHPPRGMARVRFAVRQYPWLMGGLAAGFLAVGALISGVYRGWEREKYPLIVQLGDIDETTGMMVAGDYPHSALQTAATGDFDGDGFVDLAVGAPFRPNMTEKVWISRAGAVFIRFGSLEQSCFAAAGEVEIGGEEGLLIEGVEFRGALGMQLLGPGDINGDGVDDLVIAATGDGSVRDEAACRVYVIFGRADLGERGVDLRSLDGEDGFVMVSDQVGDEFGVCLTAGGDWDGDGRAEVLIGSPLRTVDGLREAGAVLVLLSSMYEKSGETVVLSEMVADGRVVEIGGVQEKGALGRSVAAGGDWNGDGVMDIALGAPELVVQGREAGGVYVLFGRAAGETVNYETNLRLLAGGRGLILGGEDFYDWTGYSVAGVGDVNGDGVDDLLVGVNQIANPEENGGKAFVVFGGAWLEGRDSVLLDEMGKGEGFAMRGPSMPLGRGDLMGYSVAAGGDFNGDGFADFVLGAYRADAGGNDSGAAYLVFGGRDLERRIPEVVGVEGVSGGVVLAGDENGDEASSVILPLGDVNGDGFADLLVGARGADPRGFSDAGRAVVVFGKGWGVLEGE